MREGAEPHFFLVGMVKVGLTKQESKFVHEHLVRHGRERSWFARRREPEGLPGTEGRPGWLQQPMPKPSKVDVLLVDGRHALASLDGRVCIADHPERRAEAERPGIRVVADVIPNHRLRWRGEQQPDALLLGCGGTTIHSRDRGKGPAAQQVGEAERYPDAVRHLAPAIPNVALQGPEAAVDCGASRLPREQHQL